MKTLSFWTLSIVAHFLVMAVAANLPFLHAKKRQPFLVELLSQRKQAPELLQNSVSPRLVAKSRGAQKKSEPSAAKEESNDFARPTAFGQGNISYRQHPFLLNKEALNADYPEKARALKIEGRVRLLLTVGEKGQVNEAKVLSGPAFGLRQAALMLAQKMRFLPATDEFGKPKMAQIEHDVIFRLSEGE